MAQQQVTVNIEQAPKFIAGLVREGVTFKSYQTTNDNDDEIIVIEFTGGF